MKDEEKTKEELIRELGELRQRITDLKASETGRKRAEEVLYTEKEKYRILVEESPLGVSIIGRDGHYKYINPKFVEIFGYTLEDIPTGREWFAKAYPDQEYRNQVVSTWINDLKESKRGESRPPIFIVTCKDGLEKTIHFRPITMETGEQFVIYEDITEYKKAEQEIKKARDDYLSITNLTGDIIVKVDREGEWTFLNDGACEFWSKSREELIGNAFADYLHPDDQEKTRAAVEEVKTKKLVRGLVNRQKTPRGWRTVEWNGAAIFDEEGRYVAFQATGRDITERKKDKDALSMKDSALESSINAIAFADLEENLTYVNNSFLKLWGYSDDKQVLGRPATGFWQTKEKALEVIEALRERRSWIGELVAKKKDGLLFDVQLSASMVTDKVGKPICMMSSFVDITQRKKAEEELKSSEERLRILFEFAPDGIYLNDLKGTFIDGNKAAEELTGYKREELIGKNFLKLKLLPPEQILRAAALLAKNALGKPTGPHEFILNRKDGKQVTVQISTYPVKIEGKSLALGIARNVTEHKKAQKELQRTFEKLRRALGATIQALALTVEVRDAYTAGHQRRVTNLARAIAKEMKLSKRHIDGIRMAGAIHDLGKIGVPVEILNKPIPLADIEFALVKIHPVVGYNILKEMKFPWPVAKIVLQHHERMNGTGYPHGLSGEEILLEARILGVADVIEAMCSHRPYRPALGIDKALEEISKNKGILYDPQVVDTCLKLFTEKGFKFE